MALIRNRELVDDTFVRVADDAAVPASGDVLVGWTRYVAERSALTARDGRTGVVLGPETAVADVAGLLGDIDVIAVDFPKYTDGRGYSIARRLRTRFGYKGQLRAVGDILRDQLFFLERCGFDAFELKAGKDAQGALKAFDELSVTYQGAADSTLPLFRR